MKLYHPSGVNIMKITIVVPVYNEEKYIKDVIKDLRGTGYPLIVVDDGSEDKTPFILSRLRGKNITVATHKVNLGKGAAMKTGAILAFNKGADALVFIDSDSQHKVADLNGFISALEAGSEIVYGSRNMGMGMPFIRYVGNKAASIFVNILFGVYVSDILCGFRAITRKAYKKTKWDSSGYAVEAEMVIRAAKARIPFREVPVATVYHDSFKGVTLLDAFGILNDVIRWKVTLG